MNRFARFVLASSVFAFSAGAHAADAGEKAGVLPTVEQGIVPMLVAIVVFAVVLVVLSTQVWPKISTALQERADKIKHEIEAAEAARAQAKAALEQYEKSLADARIEAQKEIDKARAAAAALGAELKAKADADVQVMKSKALSEIEAAKRIALSEIYNQAASLSTSVAAKILAREITRDDQQRLVDDALGELKTAGARV